MNYYVLRNGQKYGPYTLADLQRYVGSGDVLPTDLAQSEGMQDWVPVSQVLGNIGVAQPPQPPVQNYGQTPGYGPQGYAPQGYPPAGYGGYRPPGPPAAAAQYPDPPDLHWALVLVLGMCGIFTLVWLFVISSYAKKIDPNSRGTLYYALGIGSLVLLYVFFGIGMSTSHRSEPPEALLVLMGVMYIATFVLMYMGHYNIRASLENHFNTAEPINLRLSGVMTFFFSIIYFQYHFNRINNWRRTGVLY
jgi:hypothetical protein